MDKNNKHVLPLFASRDLESKKLISFCQSNQIEFFYNANSSKDIFYLRLNLKICNISFESEC